MNNVQLLGRLVRDPELKYLDGGNAVARFSLAVDKGLSKAKRTEFEAQGKPTADFINCVAWGRLAENMVKFTGKGKRIIIQGRIQTGSYEAQDGSRRYTTDVIANNVEFIDWLDNPNSGGFNQAGAGGVQQFPSSNAYNQTNQNYNNQAQAGFNNQNNQMNNQAQAQPQQNQANAMPGNDTGFDDDFGFSTTYDPTTDAIPF